MKKFLLVLTTTALLAVIAGCSGNGTKKEEKAALVAVAAPRTPPGIILKTLDGVDSLTAVRGINYFENNSTTVPAQKIRCFLLKKDMLIKISNLLQAEQKAQTVAGWKHVTDGIRIYLSMDPTAPNAPVSLLFVSTLDSTNQVTGKKGFHHDYYSHAASATLFSSPPIVPEPTPTVAGGAALYGNCASMPTGCAEDATCTNIANLHFTPRQFAEIMVKSRAALPQRPFNTHAEWFDIDIIGKLATDTKLDALRIYFGTHPNNDPTTAYQNKDAFVITTTHLDPGTNNYVDYFDCATMQALLRIPKLRLHNVPALDKGELCPENCNIDSGSMDQFVLRATNKAKK